MSSPDRVINNASSNVTYPLIYDSNGGTEVSPTSPTVDDQGGEPTRDGMKFVGWSTTKLAPFDTVSDAKAHVTSTTTMPAAKQTMYAVWVRDGEPPTSYTVTFNTQMNSNGIAGSAITLKTETVSPNGTATPPAPPTPYNQGIQFMGWGVSKDDTDASGEGEMNVFDPSVPINSNETIWALWGYEDTLAGHKCVMGIDTVAQCFPDPVLRDTLIHEVQANVGLQSSDVWTQRDALFFGHLNCNLKNETEDKPLRISELDGLQTLTGLGQLHISNVAEHTLNNHSRDLHQLKYLSKLSNLFANGDGISDVSNFSGLSKLATLYLADNNISDLSGLSRLPDLQTLDLDNNAQGSTIPDLSTLISSPTVGLTSVKGLYLSGDKIVDVSPLAHLSTLNTLRLKNNKIESIDSLASLTAMYELSLDNNKITDISIIKKANFPCLSKLGLSANQISDISSLSDMTTLTQLWLHHNNISDVSPLAGLTGLTTLYIGSNQILDISSLKNLAGLSGGTNNSCDVGYSNFCADKQQVKLPQQIADPGVSMPTAVTLKKAADGLVAGAAVDSTSIHSTTPGARFDAEHQQLTWDGPMQYNNDDSPKDLTQTFDADAQFPNTIGNFSGTITESYKVAWHTVTFDPGEGTLPSGQPSSVQVHSGYKIAAPTSEPSRNGYRFMGWTCAADVAGVCNKGDFFDFANTAVTKDVPLNADWREWSVQLPFTGISKNGLLSFGILLIGAMGAWGIAEALRRQLVWR